MALVQVLKDEDFEKLYSLVDHDVIFVSQSAFEESKLSAEDLDKAAKYHEFDENFKVSFVSSTEEFFLRTAMEDAQEDGQ